MKLMNTRGSRCSISGYHLFSLRFFLSIEITYAKKGQSQKALRLIWFIELKIVRGHQVSIFSLRSSLEVKEHIQKFGQSQIETKMIYIMKQKTSRWSQGSISG